MKNDEKVMTVQQKEICTFAGLSSFVHHVFMISHHFCNIYWEMMKHDEQMMTVQQKEICTFAGLSSFVHHVFMISHHFCSIYWEMMENDDSSAKGNLQMSQLPCIMFTSPTPLRMLMGETFFEIFPSVCRRLPRPSTASSARCG